MASIVDPNRLLENLIAQPRENEWLEFKCNEFEAEKCSHYISALANSAMLQDVPHAYLVYGVENGTHAVVGTEVRLKAEKIGNEPFENWISRKLDPRLNLTIVEFGYAGKHVEIIAIEPAYQRPVRVDGEAYIRIDSQRRRLRDYPERERSIWLIASRFVFERGVASMHRNATDIKREFDVPTLLKMLGKPQMSDAASIEYLRTQELINDDMQGAFDVTNLCAILCAQDLSRYPTISPKAPRVITYKGRNKLESVGDDTGRRGYAITFPKILAYIMEKTPFREEMRHGIRVTVHSYPEITVREFLANAMIHQDFTLEAGYPLVEIFEDRMQITNPGIPLVEVERFIDAPSKTRNIRLAALMRQAGLCEARGSGVDRAVQAIEDDKLPPPHFRVVENSLIVTLFTERPFAALSKEDRIRGCYQHACLKYEAHDPMSNGSLRLRFGLSTRQYPQISEVISEAIAARAIRPLHEDQGNRTARYLPFWA
jgi:ATP-dependent DNA helicase RecG